MVSVFISHSHKDRIIALKLHDILSQNQVVTNSLWLGNAPNRIH